MAGVENMGFETCGKMMIHHQIHFSLSTSNSQSFSPCSCWFRGWCYASQGACGQLLGADGKDTSKEAKSLRQGQVRTGVSQLSGDNCDIVQSPEMFQKCLCPLKVFFTFSIPWTWQGVAAYRDHQAVRTVGNGWANSVHGQNLKLWLYK